MYSKKKHRRTKGGGNDDRNRTYKKFLIKKDGLAFLVMGYTGKKAAEYKSANKRSDQVSLEQRITTLEKRVADLEKKATAATAANLKKEVCIIPLENRSSRATNLFRTVQEALSQSLSKTQQQVHEQAKQE